MIRVMGYLTFRCVVDGCASVHKEPYRDLDEKDRISSSGFICQNHLGEYQWASRVTSRVEMDDATQKILQNPKGAVDPEQLKADKDILIRSTRWVIVKAFPEYGDHLMRRREAVFGDRKIVVPGIDIGGSEDDPFATGFEQGDSEESA